VVDLAGQVKAGTWVVIKSGSFRATPTIDPGGNFTVASVPTPYDVWVIVEGTSPGDYLRDDTRGRGPDVHHGAMNQRGHRPGATSGSTRPATFRTFLVQSSSRSPPTG
jgi:hypothetical protein